MHPVVAEAIRSFDAVIIGPGSFFTSLMPPLLMRGVKEALMEMRGPIVLISNLLTEGSGMEGFTAADAATWVSRAIGRPVDFVIDNTSRCSSEMLARYAAERKTPLELGNLDSRIETVLGPFWKTEIARHDRRRLSFAVWSVLSARLLRDVPESCVLLQGRACSRYEEPWRCRRNAPGRPHQHPGSAGRRRAEKCRGRAARHAGTTAGDA